MTRDTGNKVVPTDTPGVGIVRRADPEGAARDTAQRRRQAVFNRFERMAKRLPSFERRRWFRLSEIAAEYARKPEAIGSRPENFDAGRQADMIEALRSAILQHGIRARWVPGDKSPESFSERWLPAESAYHADFFPPLAPYLWIDRTQIAAWFRRAGIKPPQALHLDASPGPGRPRGSGYERADAPLVEEMHRLIESGAARSVNEAAGMVADRARGQSRDAKQRRLRERYAETYARP